MNKIEGWQGTGLQRKRPAFEGRLDAPGGNSLELVRSHPSQALSVRVGMAFTGAELFFFSPRPPP